MHSPNPTSVTELDQPYSLNCQQVLGVPIAITDYEQVLDWMDAMVQARAKGSLTAAAVNLIMCAREQHSANQALAAMTLVVPDGQPLVWALQLLGERSATRVYGPELMARHCARAAATGTPIFLYGGRTEAALARLQSNLLARYPGLRIAGAHSPPFHRLSPAEEQEAVLAINASGAQVVWVGIGQPKQEIWMASMRSRLNAPLLCGVGAAFDFHAGLVAQAPAWMGAHGLEWIFRLSREPRRLWRRYARYNPLFVAAFTHQLLSGRSGLGKCPPSDEQASN